MTPKEAWGKVLLQWFHERHKAFVVVVTLLGDAVALGLLPDPWDKWATLVLTAFAAIGVERVRNAEQVPEVHLEDDEVEQDDGSDALA